MGVGRPRRRRKTRRYEASITLASDVRWRLRGSPWSGAKAVSLLLAGLLAWALYEFSFSYTFFVYGASIRGNHMLPAEAIYVASEVHEQSIFWLIPREIAARIEAQPYVKQAEVRCHLPNRVIIEVTERVPRLVWRAGQEEFWVDEEGIALPPLPDQAPPPLLLIDDEGKAAARSEEKKLKPGVAEGILLVAEAMPEVTRFRYDRRWGLIFQTPYGWQVALGDGKHMPYKVNVLLALQKDFLARGERLNWIDIRFIRGIRYW